MTTHALKTSKGGSDEQLSILEALPNGILLQDEVGDVLTYNQKMLELLGLTTEQLLANISADQKFVFYAEDNSLLPFHLWPQSQILKNGQLSSQLIVGVRHKDEKVLWLALMAVPYKLNAQGNRIGTLTTFTDVTMRVLERRGLTENELDFRHAQEIAQIGSWSYEIASGRIKWSPQMYKLFSVKVTATPTMEVCYRVIHPDDHKLVGLEMEKCVQTKLESRIRYRVKRGNQMCWVEGVLVPRQRVDGSVDAIYGTVQDISAQVQMEQENSFLTESLEIGIWKWDITKNVLTWDASMYKIFGADPLKFSGAYEAWENALLDEDKPAAREALRQAMSGEKDFDTSFRIRTEAGEVRTLGGKAIVLRDQEGDPLRIYGINWNRTKEVSLQAAFEIEQAKSIHQAKLASLGEMSAGVAHEINNPLSIIMGSVQLLNDNKFDPAKVDHRVQIINRAVERISKIVKGLQRFSRSHSNLDKTTRVLADIVHECASLMEIKANRFFVPITYDLKSAREFIFDEAGIEQVLINLVSNSIDAVKNREEKWVRVELFDDGEETVIRIYDSGPGIPDTIAGRIFDPFFTTKEVGEGTGLGLSIARGIVIDNNGSLALLPNQKNTCFEIRFRN